MNAEREREIQQRLEAAEPGPWAMDSMGLYINANDGQDMILQIRGWGRLSKLGEDRAVAQQKANGEFAAHAREDVPYLLSALQAERAKREEAENTAKRLRERLKYESDTMR